MNGILLLGKDPVNEGRARASAGIEVVIGDRPELLWERTLIAAPGTRIPFDLLPAAWGFLEKWDAAVPLGNKLAADVGSEADRRATRAVIHDLRVPLHATELLFVRRNETGLALLAAWLEEMETGGPGVPGVDPARDSRLAFLRAVYRVKPRLCVLPTSWLIAATFPPPPAVAKKARPGPLVQVELSPGRFVKVHAGDEERARAMFARQGRR